MGTEKTPKSPLPQVDRLKHFYSLSVLATEQYDLTDEIDTNDLIDEMYEKGCRPFVAMPASAIKSDSVNLNDAIITFGRAPHVPQSDWTLYTIDVDRDQINPKFTGPESTFSGIVGISKNAVDANILESVEYEAGGEDIVGEVRSRIAA